MNRVEVAIIGAGPAGIATAVQLHQQNVPFVLLEQGRVGGLLHNANLVENYPGFPAGLPGTELAGYMKESLLQRGIQPIQDRVTRVGFERVTGLFRLHCEQHPVLLCESLVLATGTEALQPKHTPGWEEARGKRCFTEVVDLLGLVQQRIVVLGSGDAAFDYGLRLAERNQVAIVMRGSQPKALKLLVDRARQKDAIRIAENMGLASIERLENGLRLHWRQHQESRGLRVATSAPNIENCDYVLAAIGRRPGHVQFSDTLNRLKDQLRREQRLLMIGDLVNGSKRQAGIAIGDGIRAAMIVGMNSKTKKST